MISKFTGKINLIVVFSVCFLISCGIPGSSYKWNPALKKVNGRLTELLNKLPLGDYEGALEYPKRNNKELVITNAEQLSCFITRQGDSTDSKANLAFEALAVYNDSGNMMSTFVYAALLRMGEPVLEKKNSYIDELTSLFGMSSSGTMLKFCPQEIKGLSEPLGDCKMYYIHGTAADMQSPVLTMDYITLEIRKNNLYLEIAMPAEGDQILENAIRKQNYDNYEYLGDCNYPPFMADTLQMLWTRHPVLKKMLEVHRTTGLEMFRTN
jgi:hypothetical protein